MEAQQLVDLLKPLRESQPGSAEAAKEQHDLELDILRELRQQVCSSQVSAVVASGMRPVGEQVEAEAKRIAAAGIDENEDEDDGGVPG